LVSDLAGHLAALLSALAYRGQPSGSQRSKFDSNSVTGAPVLLPDRRRAGHSGGRRTAVLARNGVASYDGTPHIEVASREPRAESRERREGTRHRELPLL
jgi:hypothetical protein